MLAAGGEVYFGDETTLREFPPLRCLWSKKGEQAQVVISGKNARRVIVGAINIATGKLVRVVRERGRGEDVAEGIRALGEPEPGVPRLLVLDNAPPHQTHAARDVASELKIQVVKLPFRSPELNPIEDLWRALKRVIAANRVYSNVDELAERATSYLDSLSNDDVLRLSGLRSSKFHWLST